MCHFIACTSFKVFTKVESIITREADNPLEVILGEWMEEMRNVKSEVCNL